jgi:hypothetical protein
MTHLTYLTTLASPLRSPRHHSFFAAAGAFCGLALDEL